VVETVVIDTENTPVNMLMITAGVPAMYLQEHGNGVTMPHQHIMQVLEQVVDQII
jgi:hypothetical protein